MSTKETPTQVRRYRRSSHGNSMHEDIGGEWMKASDYDALVQQIEAMRRERLRWIVQLLKARDEFAKSDHNAAYHELYKIASPDLTKLEPWAEFEQEVAALQSVKGAL